MELSQELKTNDIPILIPIKGVSKRCPDKNRDLLPFTIKLLKYIQCLKHCVVISDCVDLLLLAKKYNLKTHLEIRDDNQDELMSCYNYIKEYDSKAFFLLPVTQPFRNRNLLKRCYLSYLESIDEVDFITSFTETANRERFHLVVENDIYAFKYKNKTKRGEFCSSIRMIDGAAYLIKSSFIEKIAASGNTNKAFWKGRFKCVENQAPFMDVDTVYDMENIELLKFYLQDKL